MATVNLTFTEGRRRSPGAMPAVVITPELRAHLAAQVTAFLDAATFLLDVLNAADAQHADMEPDADGEEDNQDCCAAADDDPVSTPCRQNRNDFAAGSPEDDEASDQMATLAPNRVPARVIHFPRRLRTGQVMA